MFGAFLFSGHKIASLNSDYNISVNFISKTILPAGRLPSKSGVYLAADIRKNPAKTPFYIYLAEETFSLVYNLKREEKQKDDGYKNIVWVSEFFQNLFYVFAKVYSDAVGRLDISVKGKTLSPELKESALNLNYGLSVEGFACGDFNVILPLNAADFLVSSFGVRLYSDSSLESLDAKLSGVFKKNVSLKDILNELEGGDAADFIQKVILKKGNIKYAALFIAFASPALKEKIFKYTPPLQKKEIELLLNNLKKKYGALDKFSGSADEKVNIRYAPLILRYSEKKTKIAAVFKNVKKIKILLALDKLLNRYSFSGLIDAAKEEGTLVNAANKIGQLNFLKAVKNNKPATAAYLTLLSKRGRERAEYDIDSLRPSKEEGIENQIKLIEELALSFRLKDEVKRVNAAIELYLKAVPSEKELQTITNAAGVKNILKTVSDMEEIKNFLAPFFGSIMKKLNMREETDYFFKERRQNGFYIKEKKYVLKSIEELIKSGRLAAAFLNKN